jgi:hypothetical protein
MEAHCEIVQQQFEDGDEKINPDHDEENLGQNHDSNLQERA